MPKELKSWWRLKAMSKKQFDLHLHSYYSDGKDAPKVILKQVKKAGLALASLTDHNSVTHLSKERQLAHRLRVNLLTGVELSCLYQGRHIHLLGYHLNLKKPRLRKILIEIQRKRKKGVLTIAKKLRLMGFDIQDQELLRLPTEYYGLAHIIRCLLKKPAEKKRITQEVGSNDIFAVIKHYFSQARQAYVPEDYLSAVKMIKLLKTQGGLVVLAHPGAHLRYREDALITALKASGLDGVEVFTPKHNWDQIVHYQLLAKKLKLAVTAGSNYHEDFHQQDIPIFTPIGFLKTPPGVFTEFLNFLTTRTDYKLKF